MQKLGAFIAALAAALVLFFMWMARIPPFDGYPEPDAITFADLHVDQDTVRVSGTAHYPLRLSVTRVPRLGADPEEWWLFPLFAPGDTVGRKIVAMVLSPAEPERLVGFEDLDVVAWVRPPGAGITPVAMDAYREAGYSFDGDALVLLEAIPEAMADGDVSQ